LAADTTALLMQAELLSVAVNQAEGGFAVAMLESDPGDH
jgi:hypothetical protein